MTSHHRLYGMMGWHQTTSLPVEIRPYSKELWSRHGKKRQLDCALRNKAALFRDTNCATVSEVVRWAIFANHPRMVRYGVVQLKRAHIRAYSL
jgi:hypothetical protein